ncbi:hypothetical protein EV702DRAFT_164667 [Suillus placidus]|uniref:DUF5648 domain-containing protein n=1 Tax=Suillus placidus TaxID=48579 RepID=A0A9P6ZFH3_9AGAM|nr:hypothetical protein EV702DRAFT_164667 [Suillus placidus]
MKASIFSFALFVAFTKAFPSARPANIEVRDGLPAGCCDPGLAVGFLRAYQPTYVDHFYTTDVSEMNNAITNLGYNSEGVAANVFPNQGPSTIPLYRMYNPQVIDHLYTTSYPEVQNAAANGYNYEEIAAYVYDTNICGSIALYRLYSSAGTDHFYTTSASEANNAVAQLGYTMEGVAGYVLPA